MDAVMAMKNGTPAGTGADGLSEELFARWISFVDASDKTIETYTRAIRQFLRYLADKAIQRPTREDIIGYRDYLLQDRKATTVQAYLMAVKQFFKWTAQEGIYPDVADHVKGARLDRGFKKDYLTTRQAIRLLGSVDRSILKGKRDYALLCLMITTGLRTIEVARANVGDIRTAGDATVLYIQGKGRTEKSEYVKLAGPVEEAIMAYLKERGRASDREPLFASIAHRNAGGPMTTRSISRIVKSNMAAADLVSDRLTAHSLRHTAATLNLLNGGTTEETMQLLRHRNINTTLIYAHALDRAGNQSEERVAKAIFG